MEKIKMIPNSFELHGSKWTVEFKDDPTNGEWLGHCYAIQQKIELHNSHQGVEIPIQSKTQTFFHELIHAFLNHGGYTELNQDESFVTHMGNCLHQYLKTADYDEPDLPF